MATTVRVEELAADDAGAVQQVALLRWQQWGDEPGSQRVEDWIHVTTSECRREPADVIPYTLIARDDVGHVVGAVGLVPTDAEGLDDRGPWVVGTVVTPECRGQGIGMLLMAALHDRAIPSLTPIWVSTQSAAGFYKRCGYTALSEPPHILCYMWAPALDAMRADTEGADAA